MANLVLNGNPVNTAGNPSVTGLRASKRIKAIGGAWDTSGFSPANDMANNVATITAVVTDNRVYEFKVDALCSEGGPVQNLNGIQEGIHFVCIPPSLVATHNAVTITEPLTGTDITKVRLILKRTSDDVVISNSTANNVGSQAIFNVPGLAEDEAYYFTLELYAMVNGVEVISSSGDHIGDPCGGSAEFEFTTEEAPASAEIFGGMGNSIGAACSDERSLFIADPNADVINGITVYADAGLTTAATGFTVVRGQDGRLWNINNTTGLVGSAIVGGCGGSMVFNNTMSGGGNILGAVGAARPTPVFYYITVGSLGIAGSGTAVGIHGSCPAGAYNIGVPVTLVAAAELNLLVNGLAVDTVSAPVTGTYNLSGTYTAADNVEIRMEEA